MGDLPLKVSNANSRRPSREVLSKAKGSLSSKGEMAIRLSRQQFSNTPDHTSPEGSRPWLVRPNFLCTSPAKMWEWIAVIWCLLYASLLSLPWAKAFGGLALAASHAIDHWESRPCGNLAQYEWNDKLGSLIIIYKLLVCIVLGRCSLHKGMI